MDGLEHLHLAPPLICWMVLRALLSDYLDIRIIK
jgi:hypothetical protein